MKKATIILAIAAILIFAFNMKVISAQESPSREQIDAYTEEIGGKYNICPELIQAIIERESGYDVNAVNGSCQGLMQVSGKWHSGRMEKLGVSSLYNAYGNILVGTDYLVELFEEYEDAALVLMIYHGESNAIEKWESGEISSYASGILERSAELEREHGK